MKKWIFTLLALFTLGTVVILSNNTVSANTIRLCHNKQLINSHFYRGVSELPYKLKFDYLLTRFDK